MSLTLLFALLAFVYVALLLQSCRGGNGIADWLVRALLVALLYDNSILALSGVASEANWYYGASWGRYFAHVVVLPPLVLSALLILHRAGIRWAGSGSAKLLGTMFTVLGIGFGFVTEIVGLELVREELWQHARFVSAHASPPLATIVTNAIVLVFSAILWRRTGWPWLFSAALLIFLVNGGSVGFEWGIVAGNLAEVVFASAWVFTLARFNTSIDNSHLPAR